ncbi:MAG: hypothetical protein RSA90_07485 [Lachnospiraceae bacterium]
MILETFMNQHIVFYLLGVVMGLGIVSKVIAVLTLKQIVKAASVMNKSPHPLMRLVRAKFEHTCMISDKVENVDAFVDKYIYEYKVCGLYLHTWRQIEKQMIWLCGVIGLLGACVRYGVYGMDEAVLWYGAFGGIGMVFLLLGYLMFSESDQIQVAHTYMVDYLENVCAHRYVKTYKREASVPIQVMVHQEEQQEPIKEPNIILEPIQEPEPIIMPEPIQEPEPIIIPEPIKEPEPIQEPERISKPMKIPEIMPTQEPKEVPEPQIVMIREILEEFLA